MHNLLVHRMAFALALLIGLSLFVRDGAVAHERRLGESLPWYEIGCCWDEPGGTLHLFENDFLKFAWDFREGFAYGLFVSALDWECSGRISHRLAIRAMHIGAGLAPPIFESA